MAMHRLFTGDRLADLLKMYASGQTVIDIAKTYSCSACAVKNALNRNGISIRSWHESYSLGRLSPTETIKTKTLVNNETGCWEWIKPLQSNGYAKLTYNGKIHWAHRFSYEAFVSEIPEGMVVCHKCDNPKCVNPSHMFLGTQKDNIEDAVRKGRNARGFMFPHTKLSQDDKEEILRLALDGVLYQKIADIFGVCKQYVGRISINQGVRRNGKC